VGLLECYVSLSVVFMLNIHLCLRTGGQWSKFVRVGYKASLSTDVCTQYHARNGAKGKERCWDVDESTIMGTTPIMKDTLTVSTSGGPLDLNRSVGVFV
jgi:hypothetical protein